MRVDLYRFVHKAQRYHLFQFAGELSRADVADAGTQIILARGVHTILEMLHDHAHNEETYIHPLFDAIGNEAARLNDEHAVLDQGLAQLASVVEHGHWSQLYPTYMRFLGEYLLHIDGEERAQTEVLWPRFSDAELGAVFLRFKAERSPAAAREDLVLMLPALNVPELQQLFHGMRTSAPVAVFNACAEIAKGVLGAARWDSVGVSPLESVSGAH
jgi:hypothetical protein